MKNRNQIQQGDVLLEQVDSLPSGAKKQQREGRLVIAEGEATGHAHVITDTGATIWTLEKNSVTDMYVEVETPVTISHDEHKDLPIPPGIYKVAGVREYDHLEKMARRVID